MDICIRLAKQSDYELLLPLFKQIHEVHVFVRPDLYKENATPVEQPFFEKQLMDDSQHIFVAMINKQIVGVVVTKKEEVIENTFVKARSVLFIKSLCVADTHRKNGIGKKLMTYVFDFGKSLKVDSIELGVSEQNSSAIDFYHSIGMKTKSRKMEIILE
ncbi:GNAT family N-acetyltransferase [Alkalihalobacillus pseudalcaliphilus]|uniref:GNAT family N-acetyltransferase n=1 Tax=Alkalihalobacillus pseudalcaliphilus TaxID=79884 RepID=UPI00064D9C80|nr:GNAT family N-acetyltransferase [Alkalihalobacillus pseudalcaliphilus]KMK76842.1 acetyltransferase [Alkalihalobacillus pseudalcaliphilus]